MNVPFFSNANLRFQVSYIYLCGHNEGFGTVHIGCLKM